MDSVKRSLLLRSVAHLVALLNEMPKDDAGSSAASTTVAADERSAPAPEFCDRASSEHMGWPTQVAGLAASSLAPVPEASPVASRIVSVAVSAQLAERAANFQLGTRWLGGPLVWQLTDRTEPQPFLSQQRCIVLSGGEAGYAANARTMRDSSTRGHIDVILCASPLYHCLRRGSIVGCINPTNKMSIWPCMSRDREHPACTASLRSIARHTDCLHQR